MFIFSRRAALHLLNFEAVPGLARAYDCMLCGAACEAAVCAPCRADLPPAPEEPPPAGVSRAAAAFAYRFPLDRLVQRFKFDGDLAAGRWLAEAVAARASAFEPPGIVVAPPSRAPSLHRRGFNPALEVAKVVARRAGAPCRLQAFAWCRATEPQSRLGGGRRRENLRGAFRCRERLDGRRVWIVDDVLTTGATVSALAAAARAAGAADVCAFTIARAPAPGGR